MSFELQSEGIQDMLIPHQVNDSGPISFIYAKPLTKYT